MHNTELGRARFSDDYTYLIDSRGKRRNYDDPVVVHIWAYNEFPYYNDMLKNLFDKRGWRYRFAGKINQRVLQDAKKVCSGRECLGCLSGAGAVYKDIVENRGTDELSLYYYLNQQGPCQIGAWPDMWYVFAERLGVQNAIFNAFPIITTNFLGQGNRYGTELLAVLVLYDIFHESENVIKCLAKDKEEALKRFAIETGKVIDGLKRNLRAVESALRQWAKEVSKIPLLGTVAEPPKVLILGGGELEMLHFPVTDYFIRQGIIPKKTDLTEFIFILTAEYYTRYAFRRGKIVLKDQIKRLPFSLSLFHPKTNVKEWMMAMKSGIATLMIDFLRKRYHGIAKKSGLLLSDRYFPLLDNSLEGDTITSVNPMTETSQTVGEYMVSSNSGVFDGIMHLRTFNCQPAVNTQAIIRPVAAKRDIPYAALDMEGPWLSASQMRILEALSVQAKRYHTERH
jgi:predicted nucleotide-binding protein (sugar kinase/HSP70/actin superfamily)